MIPRNIDYYLQRTSHGSTLSRRRPLLGAAPAPTASAPGSCSSEALDSDVADIQGGTTSEGIHLGAMAGTVDLVQRCYTGIEIRDDILWLNPCLPDPLSEVSLRLRYRRHWLALTVSHERMTVLVEEGRGLPVTLGVGEEVFTLKPGQSRTFELVPVARGGVRADPVGVRERPIGRRSAVVSMADETWSGPPAVATTFGCGAEDAAFNQAGDRFPGSRIQRDRPAAIWSAAAVTPLSLKPTSPAICESRAERPAQMYSDWDAALHSASRAARTSECRRAELTPDISVVPGGTSTATTTAGGQKPTLQLKKSDSSLCP